MAILWQTDVDGTHYEVRSAGRTRRLYTDGVFHSQYNPAHSVTGAVWDLMFLPAFFRLPARTRRVLVLGVGGGAIIHLLHRLVGPDAITAIELDAQHLDIARRYFQVGDTGAELVCADAYTWVKSYRGAPFDLVIDDLYGESDGEPVRPAAVNARWFGDLSGLLVHDGVLVINFTRRREFQDCAWHSNRAVRRRFRSVFELQSPAYENVVAAFLKFDADSAALRRNLQAHPVLGRRSVSRRLDFRVRSVTDAAGRKSIGKP